MSNNKDKDNGQLTGGAEITFTIDDVVDGTRKRKEFGAESTEFTSQNERLFEVKIQEQQQKLRFREVLSERFFWLLVAQCAGVAVLSLVAVLCSAAWILSIIIPATLLESYKILQIIVQYTFSPGDYKPE